MLCRLEKEQLERERLKTERERLQLERERQEREREKIRVERIKEETRRKPMFTPKERYIVLQLLIFISSYTMYDA